MPHRHLCGNFSLLFANAADETGQVSERRYQVVGLPTSVFITPSGEIAHVQIGQMTDTQIDNYSQWLMAGAERLHHKGT